MADQPEALHTRRVYLLIRVMRDNPSVDIFTALEAVSSVAIEHPEWDLEETKTLAEWEKDDG